MKKSTRTTTKLEWKNPTMKNEERGSLGMLRRSSVLATVLALALTALLCPAPVFGGGHAKEKPYALILGTVWGPDGQPIYGVQVKIRRAKDHKARWELYSDHRGEFAQRLPAGPQDYIVWADLKGYKSPLDKPLQPGPEVPVHIDRDERADIGLHLTW